MAGASRHDALCPPGLNNICSGHGARPDWAGADLEPPPPLLLPPPQPGGPGGASEVGRLLPLRPGSSSPHISYRSASPHTSYLTPHILTSSHPHILTSSHFKSVTLIWSDLVPCRLQSPAQRDGWDILSPAAVPATVQLLPPPLSGHHHQPPRPHGRPVHHHRPTAGHHSEKIIQGIRRYLFASAETKTGAKTKDKHCVTRRTPTQRTATSRCAAARPSWSACPGSQPSSPTPPSTLSQWQPSDLVGNKYMIDYLWTSYDGDGSWKIVNLIMNEVEAIHHLIWCKWWELWEIDTDRAGRREERGADSLTLQSDRNYTHTKLQQLSRSKLQYLLYLLHFPRHADWTWLVELSQSVNKTVFYYKVIEFWNCYLRITALNYFHKLAYVNGKLELKQIFDKLTSSHIERQFVCRLLYREGAPQHGWVSHPSGNRPGSPRHHHPRHHHHLSARIIPLCQQHFLPPPSSSWQRGSRATQENSILRRDKKSSDLLFCL